MDKEKIYSRRWKLWLIILREEIWRKLMSDLNFFFFLGFGIFLGGWAELVEVADG
jgi:hypothetical protein